MTTTIDEKLAQSVGAFRAASRDGVVRASALSRTDRERLLKSGYLHEVVKGWLIVAQPNASPDGDAARVSTCWTFVTQYLSQRFGDNYCLSAEASLLRYVESRAVPRQIAVVTLAGSNQVVKLPFETSIVLYRSDTGLPGPRVERDGLWVLDLPAALCRISSSFFLEYPEEAEIALRSLPLIGGPTSLLRQLLTREHTAAAGRLAGAYGFLGETDVRDEIADTMQAAGLAIRVGNPFKTAKPILAPGVRVSGPQAGRVKCLWSVMREDVIRGFPAPSGLPTDHRGYLGALDARYISDLHNSLQIAGAHLSSELASGKRINFRGVESPPGSQHEHSPATRGYHQAFQAVQRSVGRILEGAAAAETVERDHREWYRQLFAPAARAGVLQSAALAGYRDTPGCPVFSRHLPPPARAVPECMDALFDRLKVEEHPGVRAVLGHFLFLYIHPYPDGNGRVGRFLMNALFAAGGYPWTILRHERRILYMDALDAAAGGDVTPLSRFLREELEASHGTDR